MDVHILKFLLLIDQIDSKQINRVVTCELFISYFLVYLKTLVLKYFFQIALLECPTLLQVNFLSEWGP